MNSRIVLASALVVLSFVMASGAMADRWHGEHHGWRHHRYVDGYYYGPRVYVAPPVVYVPPRVVYAPPPVVYAPPVAVYPAPGLSIGVNIPLR